MRSAYRTRPGRARTPTGLPRSARTSCDRGGRPLYPEDGGAHPDRGACSAGACRSAAASPCTPPEPPTGGDRFTRHQRGFTRFARPVFPSPVAPRMECGRLGLESRASHPTVASDARQDGDRPRNTGPELHTRHDVDLQTVRLTCNVRPRVARRTGDLLWITTGGTSVFHGLATVAQAAMPCRTRARTEGVRGAQFTT